ncbi:alpha/beta hydrolase fold-domain-containing protein [Pseudomassariella vexata]|uniref:Alpha/beta hydrolase fold-domain-containing protein n=1 Tax=Pseudomassariella vexata TaxID=1141098 RepID=A0A1Y2DVC9_9PEZI|nr:alpha/beta hydrolase fold-domain-containing protein [Pseudomassariella vexata]ORY63207.1 alpha/beta hydrolase fold-domain-containing protein [Pseudomassariella vexata]
MNINQPIHPDILRRLDAEYVAFHYRHLQYIFPCEKEPWSPSSRPRLSRIVLGGMKSVKVGSVQDKDVGNFQARPMLSWFHGGGWVLGGLGNENAVLRHICNYIRCVVITINCRHAPGHPYLAAINDVVVAKDLSTYSCRISISGLSAGASLAAILSIKIAHLGLTPGPVFQLLLSHVIDNTATTAGIWSSAQHAPWLTPSRTTWYWDMYLPKPSSASNCDAPKTFTRTGECDTLAPEALQYTQYLRSAGVETKIEIYNGLRVVNYDP